MKKICLLVSFASLVGGFSTASAECIKIKYAEAKSMSNQELANKSMEYGEVMERIVLMIKTVGTPEAVSAGTRYLNTCIGEVKMLIKIAENRMTEKNFVVKTPEKGVTISMK